MKRQGEPDKLPGGARIVVADDNPIQARFLGHVVERFGLEATVCHSGEEALELIRSDPPDLVLTDLFMPGMGGLGLLKKLKADKLWRNIPAIVISGSSDLEHIANALEEGAEDYILKPFNLTILKARITATIEKKRLRDQEQVHLRLVEDERARLYHLLLKVFPEPIAIRLEKSNDLIADSHDEVTVMFVDLVGFTELSAGLAPSQVVSFLDHVFSSFDQLAMRHGLEKIKTIGDAYMVAGGLPNFRSGHVSAMAAMALDVLQVVKQHSWPDGSPVRVRVGINTGPVVAGVIGKSKFIYDLWGDSVNTASRMESLCLADTIQVTAAVHERLRDEFILEKRGIIPVKGKGEMVTYFLLDRRSTEEVGLGAPGRQVHHQVADHIRRSGQELEDLVLEDKLTGLKTTRAFVALFGQATAIARREQHGILLLLLHLVNLGDINRRFGHDMGDVALRETANLLRETFRDSDLVARVGAGHFLVAGHENSPAGSSILASRFSRALRDRGAAPGDLPCALQVEMASARWSPKQPVELADLLRRMESELAGIT